MNTPKQFLTRMEIESIEDRMPQPVVTQAPPIWIDATASRGGDVASYIELPFIHKGLILRCLCVAMLLGWLAILFWPRSYESQAKLLVRVGRESVSLDPTATTSATLMLQKTQEEEIISALEILNSRKVAETVVDALGPTAILDGVLPDTTSKEPSRLSKLRRKITRSASDAVYQVMQFARIKDDISNRELAVRRLQATHGIYSPKKSTVITIDARSRTPEMAQAIVRETTNAFLNEHVMGARTDGSHAFFVEQSAAAEDKLNQMVADRSKFMQENQIVSIDANRLLLKEQLTGIDRDLVITHGELQQAISQAKDLQEKLAANAERTGPKLAASYTTWSGMRQQIYELELQEQSLAANYTAGHPKLRQVREQLKGAREILADLKKERVDEDNTPNPAKIKLFEELQRQETRVAGLQSVIRKKNQQRADMERQTEILLEHERQLIQKDRDIRLMEANLRLMREKLEEARVIEELQAKKISNVRVFQPATFVERPVSPRKKLLAAASVFLGLTTGLGLSLVRQISSPSLRTSDDVESQLGYQVLSSIPRLRQSFPKLLEQRLHRQKCQAIIAESLLSQRRPQTLGGRSLGVIGADSGAGASTLAINLAIAAGIDCRLKTILVDGDARERSVSKQFGLNGMPGLFELVNGDASHDECIQKAKDAPIDLIASAADSCDEILTSSAAEIAQALQAYQNGCDLLIVDLPPANQPDQAVALAQHLDCVLVVVESEKTQIASAERLLRRLSESDTDVLGVVLNKTNNYLPNWLRRCVAPQR